MRIMKVTNDYTTVNQSDCKVSGDHCTVNGSNCKVSGDYCIVNGFNCEVFGDSCIVNGSNCEVFGDHCTNNTIPQNKPVLPNYGFTVISQATGKPINITPRGSDIVSHGDECLNPDIYK